MTRSPQINTVFINLQSDYGFKRAFGTKKFQKNVIRLLQAALGEDMTITRIVLKDNGDTVEKESNLSFHDKEVLPAESNGKRIVYDVYFTLKIGKGESLFKPSHLLKEDHDKEVEHHFILEMQNVYTPPFEDRMTYYVSKIIAQQGKTGWNYDLDPVILLGITDFDFPHLTPQLSQEFELRERTTGESLTKKLRLLFYSLKQVPEKWEECETELQRRLYLIKNMDKLDKNSKPYKEGGYEELFESAESAQVVGEDAVLYSQSLAHLREVQSGLDFRFEQGREEGRLQGIEQGIEQGREEGIEIGRFTEKENLAKKMKAGGIDLNFIAEITGLPLQIIQSF